MEGDLFDDVQQARATAGETAPHGDRGEDGGNTPRPLAERLRPVEPEELVGQEHLLSAGGLLGELLRRGRVVPLILWGPPGSGKTTLARLLARRAEVHYEELSATAAGVREVRAVIETARRLRGRGRATMLFLDEIHRFNKAQQDALLAAVERGELVLVGATTENPSFELVPPLLSRCRVVRLRPLPATAIETLLRRALAEPPPRGLARPELHVAVDALSWLARMAGGDARTALNALETACELAEETGPAGDTGPTADRGGDRVDGGVAEHGERGAVLVTRAHVEAALQDNPPRHDAEAHYDLASALQKCIRNSDADAALYWLARLLEAGERPEYVARRLIRTASEDVGLADPQALLQCTAALQAVHAVGMPEGALALAQAVVYLALAPKSDALERAYGEARRAVRERGAAAVPLHLRNPVTPLMAAEGYGQGYQHPHAAAAGLTAMEGLPEALRDERFYRPTRRGWERRLRRRLEAIRRLRRRLQGRASEEPSE